MRPGECKMVDFNLFAHLDSVYSDFMFGLKREYNWLWRCMHFVLLHKQALAVQWMAPTGTLMALWAVYPLCTVAADEKASG